MNRTALDQYEGLVTDALNSCSAKLRKSFKTAFIQLMILYMVLPRKINFTQMGRYSDSSEQRFRQLFEREFDWIQFNLFLMRQRFGESVRKAIDASYISKSWFIIPNREDIKSISPPTLTWRPKTSSNTTVHDSRSNFAFGIPSSLPGSMIARQET